MRKWVAVAIISLLPLSVWADKASFSTVLEAPWLTGPLLAPSAFAVPIGHYYFEPYVYAVANTGQYNRDWKTIETETFWNNSFQPFIQIGLTQWMDFQINPTLVYNYTAGAAKWAIGDLPLGFDIMLYSRGVHPSDWITALKIELRETIPLGKYQNFNSKKKRTDMGGQGSWVTQFVLVWGQLVHVWGDHFFDTRLALTYNLPAPVKVKGFNSYGGGFGTRGKVYPAQNFQIDLGMELTLTQNWVLAFDIVGIWAGRTRFKGDRGVGLNGLPATVELGSAAQYQLAPAIEYNWSENIGIIAGAWFTFAGRNSAQFFSGVAAFSYYL